MSKGPGLKRAREINEIETGMKYCRKAEGRKMSKRPGLKGAREMNEIETGMKYCRKAECGECQKGLNISYLEVNQTESGQESMP